MSPETTDALRIPPPDHRPPYCSVCGEEADGDCDGWACTDCGIYWSDPHGPGALIDESRPICGAELQPFKVSTMPLLRDEEWAMIWLTGQQQGIGTSRSQGAGRYTITEWEQVS